MTVKIEEGSIDAPPYRVSCTDCQCKSELQSMKDRLRRLEMRVDQNSTKKLVTAQASAGKIVDVAYAESLLNAS